MRGHDTATIILPKTVRGGPEMAKTLLNRSGGTAFGGGTVIGATDPM